MLFYCVESESDRSITDTLSCTWTAEINHPWFLHHQLGDVLAIVLRFCFVNNGVSYMELIFKMRFKCAFAKPSLASSSQLSHLLQL